MSEVSQCVYLRTNDREIAAQWLRRAHYTGYALAPQKGWAQCLVKWRQPFDLAEKNRAVAFAPGLAIYFCYAAETHWSFIAYHDGEPLFGYRCCWEDDEYQAQGIDIADLATLLEVSETHLLELLYTGDDDASWEELADNASGFANLLELPNTTFASFEYAHPDAEAMGMTQYFVVPDLDADEDSFELSDLDDLDDLLNELDLLDELDLPFERRTTQEPSTPKPSLLTKSSAPNSPLNSAYQLANAFLDRLHREETIELALDTPLVRETLVERLTDVAIHNPVSNDRQLAHHWLEALLESPEVVDVYASDEALLSSLRQTMEEIRPG